MSYNFWGFFYDIKEEARLNAETKKPMRLTGETYKEAKKQICKEKRANTGIKF